MRPWYVPLKPIQDRMSVDFIQMQYPLSPVDVRHALRLVFTLFPDDFSDSMEEAPVSRVC